MCLSASQIIYSFIMMPSTLPPSYIRFLNKQAAKDPWVWKAVQVWTCGVFRLGMEGGTGVALPTWV